MVVVETRKTGNLRIRIDPKEENKYLVPDYILIPNLDKITAKLAKNDISVCLI